MPHAADSCSSDICCAASSAAILTRNRTCPRPIDHGEDIENEAPQGDEKTGRRAQGQEPAQAQECAGSQTGSCKASYLQKEGGEEENKGCVPQQESGRREESFIPKDNIVAQEVTCP